MGRLPRLAVAAAIAACAALLDLETKRWAAGELRRGGPRVLANGELTLMYRENTGGAFGLLRDLDWEVKRPLFIAQSSLVASALAALLGFRLLRRPARLDVANVGLAALLGGTLGNLADRVARGRVIDFIDFTHHGPVDWPAFNVADMAIAVGVVLCLWGLLVWMRRPLPGADGPESG